MISNAHTIVVGSLERQNIMTVATLSRPQAKLQPQSRWSETLRNFWIDIALFLMFIVDMNTHLTGMAVHEWLGIVFGGSLIYHIFVHWNWISNSTRKLFGKLPTVQRIRYIVDLTLFGMMTIVVASGILISRDALPTLGITLNSSRYWSMLHHTTSNLVIVLVGLHLALSWSWITTAWTRYIWAPLTGRKAISTHVAVEK